MNYIANLIMGLISNYAGQSGNQTIGTAFKAYNAWERWNKNKR